MSELYEFLFCPAHGIVPLILSVGALPFVFLYHSLKGFFK